MQMKSCSRPHLSDYCLLHLDTPNFSISALTNISHADPSAMLFQVGGLPEQSQVKDEATVCTSFAGRGSLAFDVQDCEVTCVNCDVQDCEVTCVNCDVQDCEVTCCVNCKVTSTDVK